MLKITVSVDSAIWSPYGRQWVGRWPAAANQWYTVNAASRSIKMGFRFPPGVVDDLKALSASMDLPATYVLVSLIKAARTALNRQTPTMGKKATEAAEARATVLMHEGDEWLHTRAPSDAIAPALFLVHGGSDGQVAWGPYRAPLPDPDTRAVITSGAWRQFCAGVDEPPHDARVIKGMLDENRETGEERPHYIDGSDWIQQAERGVDQGEFTLRQLQKRGEA